MSVELPLVIDVTRRLLMAVVQSDFSNLMRAIEVISATLRIKAKLLTYTVSKFKRQGLVPAYQASLHVCPHYRPVCRWALCSAPVCSPQGLCTCSSPAWNAFPSPCTYSGLTQLKHLFFREISLSRLTPVGSLYGPSPSHLCHGYKFSFA